jgi:ferredoxin-NADP reductase
MALCLGNIFSYIISPNYRLQLSLVSKTQLSKDTFLFGFKKPKDFNFIPGQYMEWTLPHTKPDSRGNRRYFSISSSPTENEITMTVKFYDKASSYKSELFNLQDTKQIVAAQVSGDFVLPQDLKTPLVLIAGGVGIAPFRSMIQYIIDKNLMVDIILLYTNRTKADILFADIFTKAEVNDVKTIYNLTDAQNVSQDWEGSVGYITDEKIKQLIPDYKNRFYYLSGPQLMVQNFEGELTKAGISKKQIKTDFFPGYNEK